MLAAGTRAGHNGGFLPRPYNVLAPQSPGLGVAILAAFLALLLLPPLGVWSPQAEPRMTLGFPPRSF